MNKERLPLCEHEIFGAYSDAEQFGDAGFARDVSLQTRGCFSLRFLYNA